MSDYIDEAFDSDDVWKKNGALRKASKEIERLNAEIDRLNAETEEALRDKLQEYFSKELSAFVDTQKSATERYGMKPGELQWAWRQGHRTDRSEIEWAIVDALAMGGVAAWPGDGVGCAAQIVMRQMDRAESAEREVKALREALKFYAITNDGGNIARAALAEQEKTDARSVD